MESYENAESDYTSVVDNLVTMFGRIITREVIATIVESCGGDLNLSVDAIMKITNDDKSETNQRDNPSTTSKISNMNPSVQQTGLSISYAAHAAQNKGIIPKRTQAPAHHTTQRETSTQDFWTDQIRQIIEQHNKGYRVMIILRGVPGSGKTYLSKLLVETMIGSTFINYKNHILSSDDYFMVRGQYVYDKSRLGYAHSWNQGRARQSAERGLSPIIIDNTNIEIWEMQPYVIEGVKNGYIIEVVEPTTPWAKKAGQLLRRNTHNVPLITIRRMLDNYAEGVTGEFLRQTFKLSYPAGLTPPIKRSVPIIIDDDTTHSIEATNDSQDIPRIQISQSSVDNVQIQELSINTTNYLSAQREENTITKNILVNDPVEHHVEQNVTYEEDDVQRQEEVAKLKLLLEAQKRLEELEKFEKEWDNGEKWDEGASDITEQSNTEINLDNHNDKDIFHFSTINTSTYVTTNNTSTTPAHIAKLVSKPPRKEKKDLVDCESNPTGGLMRSVNDCQDWRDISLFMPPWVSPDEQFSIAPKQEIPIQTSTSSTCVEIGDTNLSGYYKIMNTAPHDINEFHIPPAREKIPEKRMLDKSTMTNEGIMMTFHCPQRERHFIAFRRLFNHIERDSLRYIFDNCCGDVNWAVENILGGEAEYELKKNEQQEESDTEEEFDVNNEQPCTCLAKYEIIPNASKYYDVTQFAPTPAEVTVEDSIPQPEKKKRDVTISDRTMQLKKQMEQNFVISDSHYSEHCLKIKKIRRGEYKIGEDMFQQPSTSGTPDLPFVLDSINTVGANIDSSEDEDGSCSNLSDSDKIVNINVGEAFIKNLDTMFGRKDMEYPDNISFNISIPTSLLNEINALWMESMMFQLDENAKKSAAMVKEDEEFARQIALKEAELLLAGKEPDVPDFKEIMDLEMAISLHLKDVSEWKNNIPTDLAAKMTHEKLFHLFPEIEKDTLLEMLMAHDNSFKATVEVLLMSMGRNDVLEAENGLNKFVIEKELERQEKMLEEQRKELSNVEWPPLPKGEVIDMATVQAYRDEAEQHLQRRNTHMQRAEEYIRRGIPQVANYYSEIATFHKTKYEHANSLAVASLMQYHASNNPDGETVDLHYFRVKEAKETMDLFIDTHIRKLRESNKRGIMLFFITGRGLHSPGRPKVKPACIKRLQQRGLSYTECNPGLLRSRITCDDKLTYQIT